MQYELKSAKSRKNPYTDENDVYGIDVIIRTKIVNQLYDGFENLDVGFCPIEKTDNINQIEAKINVFAVNFIKSKYPNT
jgi:hypothetical protein